MTAAAKQTIANFCDLAAAVLGNGYRGGETDYYFADDNEVSPMAASATADTATDIAKGDSIAQIAADVRACSACRLGAGRTNAVPGEGAPCPMVMVIGEGPGADEDATGRPFVGPAGQLLDKMLSSIGLSRDRNCFIANVIKCRPPANRDPQQDETAACAGFLARQIQLLNPHFILCAGRIASHTLLNTTNPIGRLRGKLIDYQAGDRTIPLIATYHPSALLRNEDLKRPAWEDLKMLRAALTEAGFGNG